MRRDIAWYALTIAAAIAWLAPPLACAQEPGPATGIATRQMSPWESSLAREAANDLPGARAALVNVYGPQPAIYAICVRLAWLSLRMGRYAESIDLYVRARALPGALAESTQGLVLALTAEGYRQLDRGNYPMARRDWRDAADLDPDAADARRGLAIVGASHGAAPDVWLGTFSATQNASSASVFYVGVPYRVDDQLSVRGAYRHIGPAKAAAGTTGLFGSQDELFGGVSVERGIVAGEVMAFSLMNSVATVPGIAFGGRIGGRYGATAMVAYMSVPAGTHAHAQASAQGFVWVMPSIALNGGVRYTHDPNVHSTSALVGATWAGERASVDVQVHAGTERYALTLAGPTIMSLDASTASGATVTASVALDKARMWTLFAQGQFDQLKTPDGVADMGSYTGVAVGLRWIPQ